MSQIIKKTILFLLLSFTFILNSQVNILHEFTGASENPEGSLIAVGSTLYGMTKQGGSNNYGCIFKINTDGTGFSILHSFGGTANDGLYPFGSLVAKDSTLYGMTFRGGTSDDGTIFSISTSGSNYTILHEFGSVANDGLQPTYNNLIINGTTIYGSTRYGGLGVPGNGGIIFSIGTDGSGYSILYRFGTAFTDPNQPHKLVHKDSTIYGVTERGGTNGNGTIFKWHATTGFSVLYNFSGSPTDGAYPQSLIIDGSILYGVTSYGGADNIGTLFRINIDGSGFYFISFAGGSSHGKHPYNSLLLSNSTLYGMTQMGGSNNKGIVYKIGTNGTGFSLLHSFAGGGSDGEGPKGSLILADSTLYGMTPTGGDNNGGVIFSLPFPTVSGQIWDSSGTSQLSGITVTFSHDSHTEITDASGNYSYSVPFGTTTTITPSNVSYSSWIPSQITLTDITSNQTGKNFWGNMIYYTISGTITDGTNPINDAQVTFSHNNHMVSTDASGNFSLTVPIGTTTTLTPSKGGYGNWTPATRTITSIGSNQTGQNFQCSVLTPTISGTVTFGAVGNAPTGVDSATPLAGATVTFSHDGHTETTDASGNYSYTVPWGTTTTVTARHGTYDYWSPASHQLTSISGNPSGQDFTGSANTFTLLHEFAGGSSDGGIPSGDLIANGSSLYGMTNMGGDDEKGTVFKINKDGTGFSLLHEFTGGGSDGAKPLGSLLLDGSTLYGMTWEGGVNDNGTIFKINTDSTGFTLLHSFASGSDPWVRGSLIQSNGTLFGMTTYAGSGNKGTIFKIGKDGTGFTLLHEFGVSANDGELPYGSLILDGSTMYGMTSEGGASDKGTIFKINTDGTGYTRLYDFTGGVNNGSEPKGSLVLDNSTLYGFTNKGGDNDKGVIFKINTDGSGGTILHEFSDGINDGASPYYGALTKYNSTFFGMTHSGGNTTTGSYGTIFQVTSGGDFSLLKRCSGGANDGKLPFGSLTLIDNVLYGMTAGGGDSDKGVIFSMAFPTISGTLTDGTNPISGATMTFFHNSHTETTDASGNYSYAVPWGTSTAVTPSHGSFSGWSPANRTIPNIYSHHPNQNFQGTNSSCTISGTVTDGANPISGVTLTFSHNSHTETTDASGNYSYTVPSGTTTTVTPSHTGYGSWTPSNRAYTGITTDQTGQNYQGVINTYTVSGNVNDGASNISGATVTFSHNSNTETTDASGNYSYAVPYGTTTTVSVSHAAYGSWSPTNRILTFITNNYPGQNFQGTINSYTISGNITNGTNPISGVTVGFSHNGLSTTTDASGNYSYAVPYNTTTTISPSHPGHGSWSPTNRTLNNVTANQTGQNFQATIFTYTISGAVTTANGATAPRADKRDSARIIPDAENPFVTRDTAFAIPGVSVKFSHNNQIVTSNASGNFTYTVPYGTTTTLTLKHPGYDNWTPASRTVTGISDNQSLGFTGKVIKKDLLGTWNGQGVYYKNSDTGEWVGLATHADKISCGDLDNDGIDDLIGIWAAQGGVWTYYSATSQWALLSTTADWIGAGDMNGDGIIDLLGSWSGQGVYYFDSTIDAWVYLGTPASQISSGDLDGDGSADLIGIWSGQGGVWVKYSSNSQWAYLGSTPDWIGSGDMNGDGRVDLLGTWTGQGVYCLDSISSAWVFMATPATQISSGDLDGDGSADILGIWAGQGGVWVKYSSTGQWAYLGSTPQWIAAGRMRASGASPTPLNIATTERYRVQIENGPGMDGEYLDYSEYGPGGSKFTFIRTRNPIPGQEIDEKRQARIKPKIIKIKEK